MMMTMMVALVPAALALAIFVLTLRLGSPREPRVLVHPYVVMAGAPAAAAQPRRV